MKVFDRKNLIHLRDEMEKIHQQEIDSGHLMAYYDELGELQSNICLVENMIKLIDSKKKQIWCFGKMIIFDIED